MDHARRRFSKRMTLAFLAYAVLVALSVSLTEVFPDAIWRYPLAVIPMAPFIYGVAAYVRYLRNVDELERRMALEALAIAFGATAAITFGYGFLERVGLPHINWWWVWAVMGVSWVLAGLHTKRRYR
ncbi:MAG: hypothetical protein OXN86_06780 [Chloroflexota bacterium]|nr:hypothetical protein [Chloroflexota bacterium]